jgi:CDP-glucose 4,6-dehydratase
MFAGVYSGRRILVTGHTGFKGSWLSTWLLQLGAQVAGFSLGVPTKPANFEVLGLEGQLTHFLGDIRDRGALERAIASFAPEIVFHLAAQSLVRRSYAEPITTFETNSLGILNLLEALRHQPATQVAVIITSDKCYHNMEWSYGYRENDALGGDDPYSASKACAELITRAYVSSFFHDAKPRIATTRAGNVIGGGDWASERIVPDCVRAWSKGEVVKIRHPQATRPWQHVLEPLSGYLWLGARLWHRDNRVHGESFNFGPPPTVNFPVMELIRRMSQNWPGAVWEVEEANQSQRESLFLKLCCDKALHLLDWRPVLSFPETIRLTTEWYRNYYEDCTVTPYDLTSGQLEFYMSKAKAEELLWTR